MTVSAYSLNVVMGSAYLLHQEQRLRQLARLAQPAGYAMLALAFLGWLWLVWQSFRGATALPGWLLTFLGVATILALLLPEAADRLHNEADNYVIGRLGEERLTTFLQENLDGRYTLFRNVLLPDGQGDIDAVLVGPHGVWVLEIKVYGGQHRTVGDIWYERAADGEWVKMSRNPTRQLQNNAERLRLFLKDCEVSAPVSERVVWAGDGLLVQENPAVTIWELRRRDDILDELERAEPLEPVVVAPAVEALTLKQGAEPRGWAWF